MIISDCKQLEPEWFAEHAGIPGASSMDKIITPTGKRSTQRKSYMYSLAAEALLGTREAGYTNPVMDEGTRREDEARNCFSFLYEAEIHQVGMCYKDSMKKFLCSPDGLLKDGDTWFAGIEIKNPLAKTHVEYLDRGKLPTKYFVQVQTSLYVTGLPLWFFFSYFPGLDPFITEEIPDLEFHKTLETELDKFCAELAQIIKKLK